MFEKFLIFTEVVKLSPNTFYQLRIVNHHDKLLDLIYRRKDIIVLEEVIDLVNDKYLITEFINFLWNFDDDDEEKKLIENIFKVIDYIDVSTFNNKLLICCSANGLCNFVKYLIQSGVDIHTSNDFALITAAQNDHLEVVKYLIARPDCKVCEGNRRHGADVQRNEFLLECAIYFGNSEIANYLTEKGVVYP